MKQKQGSNKEKPKRCADCGYFRAIGTTPFCGFTGEFVKVEDEPGDCTGFHEGKWSELWHIEEKGFK